MPANHNNNQRCRWHPDFVPALPNLTCVRAYIARFAIDFAPLRGVTLNSIS